MFKKNNRGEIDGEWQTVAELKVGQSIAVPKEDVLNSHTAGKIDSREWMGKNDVEWDEIESIEYKGTEQVWDIEVEGTHNFVGNNIFAHNTYITGSTGMGTSSPYAKLSIAGSDTSTPLIGADALSGFTGNLMELKLASSTLFSVSGTGFGTTTVSGLNISGSATSTSNVGFNITTGCFAINGTCVSGGGGASLTGTTGQLAYFSGTNTAIGTSTIFIDTAGRVGIGTTSPGAVLDIKKPSSGNALAVTNAASGDVMTIGNDGKLTIGAVTAPYAAADLKFSGSDYNSKGVSIINSWGTAGKFINLYHDGSTFTGDAILANLGAGGGNFTGNFMDLQKNSVTQFKVTNSGGVYAAGNVGIGTTTPYANLSIWGSATGKAFEIANSASTTVLSVSNTGFGTTTVSGLNISGSATSTSNVGFNITTGCFAINGTCVSGGGGASLTGTTGQLAYFSGTNTAIGTSTIFISTAGNVGIGTTTPAGLLVLQGAGTAKDLFSIASTTNGIPVLTVNQWGGFVQRIASTSALSIQMASGTPVFEIDTTSNTNSGIDITAGTGQTTNLLNLYSSGGTFLSGFTATGGLFMNVSSTTAINLYDGSNNAAFVVNSTGKSVGIGTSTLDYALTIQGSQTADYVARIDNANTGTGADGLLITLGVANASRTTGNYFIGFADGSKTVAGKIQGGASAVAYTTSAADIAEYFRIADLSNIPNAGEIVMLDKDKEKSVIKARNVNGLNEPLGIVSTNPGFVGNGPICFESDINCDTEYNKYNVLVSLAGQVPLKVSLENGPIAVGDYLTLSSTTPGVATKLVGSGYVVGTAITASANWTSTSTDKVIVLIKDGWRDLETNLATTNTESLIPSKWASLFDFLKTIGLEIGQNFVKIANLVTEKIIANRIETKELCIEDVCVDKTQLQAMILNSGFNTTVSTTPTVGTSTSPIIETASTTAPSVTDPVPTPEPTVTPEPVATQSIETPAVISEPTTPPPATP